MAVTWAVSQVHVLIVPVMPLQKHQCPVPEQGEGIIAGTN